MFIIIIIICFSGIHKEWEKLGTINAPPIPPPTKTLATTHRLAVLRPTINRHHTPHLVVHWYHPLNNHHRNNRLPETYLQLSTLQPLFLLYHHQRVAIPYW